MSGRAPAAAKAAHRAGAGADAPLRLFIGGEGKAGLVAQLIPGAAETGRAQGLTAEVSYRHFVAGGRAFAVAEAAGGADYIRNAVAAASTAELAVLPVDARGLSSETRRDAILASLFGIRHVVLAVNTNDRAGFDRIAAEFGTFAGGLGFKTVKVIPVSGPHLLAYLETLEAAADPASKPFRMPVAANDRGLTGTIASGRIGAGDDIAVLPSGQATRIKSIAGAGGARDAAQAGDAVIVTLADDVAVAPGDMLAALRDRPQIADQFVAHLVWMSGEELFPGRSYLMAINGGTAAATVTELKHQLDVDTLSKLAAKTLHANEVGVCNLSVARPVAFDAYADNRSTGAFVLLDRDTGETVAAGTIDFALRRATNIHLQKQAVSKSERASLKRHRPVVLWFTGLPSAGKSTVANLVESALHARGVHTIMLDGDNVRHGLNRDLGFTEPDRVENIRRIGEVSKLMTEAGLIVLCSFISPFRAERRMVRELLDSGEFIEVFVDTPLKECIARDPKGLYRRALAGEIKNFTGVDQAYEPPENPELHLSAGGKEADRLADEVIQALLQRKIL